MCAQDFVQDPFAVINADDFYGKDAFVKAADFLKTAARKMCMAWWATSWPTPFRKTVR
jgi:hypothetical protein